MSESQNPAHLPELGFTHAGRFHADDVFSAALLRMLRPDIRIFRGYEVPKNFDGIAFDIGNGEFDHHERERKRRANGTPYAAFGLLWQKYGHHLLPEEEAKRFDEKFVQPLDLDDNNGTGNAVAALIGAFNPSWDANEDENTAFEEALNVAQKLLERRIEGFAAAHRGKTLAEKALRDMKDGIVVLSTYVPWKPVLVESKAEFVIHPSPRGGISLQCVPKDFSGKLGLKIPLPGNWRGKPEEELQRITGVADIHFCHASGFMAVADSEESARQLAVLAREAEERRKAQSEADRNALKKKL